MSNKGVLPDQVFSRVEWSEVNLKNGQSTFWSGEYKIE